MPIIKNKNTKSQNGLRSDEIKAKVPIEILLAHYDRTPDGKGCFQCLFPDQHTNGDANPSASVHGDRAYCHSHQCFGDKGADIFGIVGAKQQLHSFPEQKNWILETFNLSNGTAKTGNGRIIRTHKWIDSAGRVAFHLRMEGGKSKFAWNQRADGSGAWCLKPCQPDLYQRDRVKKARIAIVCAGERDADTMNAWLKVLGLYGEIVATCNHTGENSVKPASFKLLRGKNRAYVVGDNDSTGESYRQKAIGFLSGLVTSIRLLYVPQNFNDVTEWAESGATPEDFSQWLAGAAPVQAEEREGAEGAENTTNDEGEDEPKKESQATQLVNLVLNAGCELFRDNDRRGYCTMPNGNHCETWPIRRKGFKQWMSYKYFLTYKRSPSAQAVQDAIAVLEGKALFEGKEYLVSVRIGGDHQQVYLDLGGEDWMMVHITAEGWKIVPHGEVKFRRGAGMLPLPHPVPGGNLRKLLDPFINLDSQEAWVLLIGYLVASLRPIGSQLILEANGEQGSGKSTLLDVIKAILDPNKGAKRTQPREERDLMIGANSNWVLALDNVSGIPPWFSDALCRLSTGGALATRALYSDEEEIIFEAKRPVVLNGIGAVGSRPDLLDRSIVLTLPSISEDNRRDERQFWPDFHAVAGQILGALCDAVRGAINNIETTTLPTLERMADATLWVTAAESALGWEPGTFQQAYRANRAAGNDTALESSLLYEPIREFLEKPINRPWEGMPSQLLNELVAIAGEKKTKDKNWPGNAQALRNALQRLAPNLRANGIMVEFPKRTGKGSRVILDYICNQATQPTQATPHTPKAVDPNVGNVGNVGTKHTYSYSKEAHLDL